jgi:hypothetical protein
MAAARKKKRPKAKAKTKTKAPGGVWADVTSYGLQINGFRWRTALGQPVVEIQLTGTVIDASKPASIGAIQFFNDPAQVPYDQAGWTGDPPTAMQAFMRLPLSLFDQVVRLLGQRHGVRFSAHVPASGPTQVTLTQIAYTPV